MISLKSDLFNFGGIQGTLRKNRGKKGRNQKNNGEKCNFKTFYTTLNVVKYLSGIWTSVSMIMSRSKKENLNFQSS